jgi:hypothetical protein
VFVNKKGRVFFGLYLYPWTLSVIYNYFFLNFLLLLHPAKPIKPKPRRNIVVGSGTGVPLTNSLSAFLNALNQPFSPFYII